MSFQTSYAKLLADHEYGHIHKREKHARQMYIEGMKQLIEAIPFYPPNDSMSQAYQFALLDELEKIIAEESK